MGMILLCLAAMVPAQPFNPNNAGTQGRLAALDAQGVTVAGDSGPVHIPAGRNTALDLRAIGTLDFLKVGAVVTVHGSLDTGQNKIRPYMRPEYFVVHVLGQPRFSRTPIAEVRIRRAVNGIMDVDGALAPVVVHGVVTKEQPLRIRGLPGSFCVWTTETLVGQGGNTKYVTSSGQMPYKSAGIEYEIDLGGRKVVGINVGTAPAKLGPTVRVVTNPGEITVIGDQKYAPEDLKTVNKRAGGEKKSKTKKGKDDKARPNEPEKDQGDDGGEPRKRPAKDDKGPGK